MNNTLLPISKSGIRYMVYSFVIFTLFVILDFDLLALVAFSFILIFAYLYRNPEREINIFEQNSVLSPVDGVISSIQEIKDESYLYKIEIDTTYLDVAILRAPFDATFKSIEIKHGARLSSSSSLSRSLNENVALVFSDENSNTMKIKHILKQSIAPFNIYKNINEKIIKASRYGDMSNGLTEIYLPRNFRLNLNVGERVSASQTLLGYFISLP